MGVMKYSGILPHDFATEEGRERAVAYAADRAAALEAEVLKAAAAAELEARREQDRSADEGTLDFILRDELREIVVERQALRKVGAPQLKELKAFCAEQGAKVLPLAAETLCHFLLTRATAGNDMPMLRALVKLVTDLHRGQGHSSPDSDPRVEAALLWIERRKSEEPEAG
jgi:hypothetical protein